MKRHIKELKQIIEESKPDRAKDVIDPGYNARMKIRRALLSEVIEIIESDMNNKYVFEKLW